MYLYCGLRHAMGQIGIKGSFISVLLGWLHFLIRCKGQKTPLNFVHINLSLTLLIALVIFGGGSWYARHIKVRELY